MKHLASLHLDGLGLVRGLAWLLALLLGPLPSSLAQQPNLPKLAEIKAAAERGEVEAQISLADEYASRGELAGATAWYLKAAKQNAPRAQYELGNLLSTAKPMESFRWFQAAADHGYARAQIVLGTYYRDGNLVRKNLAEAYKWFSLASAQSVDTATTARDNLILKMTADQVADGQRLFTAALPARLEPSSPAIIAGPGLFTLKGLFFRKAGSLAVINDQTFESGEEQLVKAGDQKVRVRCVEIRSRSVLIAVNGSSERIELALR